MTIKAINEASKKISDELFEFFKDIKNLTLVKYKNGVPTKTFAEQRKHRGIYALVIKKGKKTAIAYIGKTECDNRIHAHLTGNNLNGTPLKSVKQKYNKIQIAVNAGFTIYLGLHSDIDFKTPSLICIETATAIKAKSDFNAIFQDERIKSWNQRIG